MNIRPDHPFKVGIIIEKFPVLRIWQKVCLEKLIEANMGQVALVFEIGQQQNRPFSSSTLLWSVYEKFVIDHITINKPVDCSQLLECNVRQLLLETLQQSESIAALKQYNLDFILNFTHQPLVGALAQVTRYGVWAYCHGKRQLTQPGPPCFREIICQDTVTESFLMAMEEQNEHPIILQSGKLKTDWNYCSTLCQSLTTSTDWVVRVCKEILATQKLPQVPSISFDERGFQHKQGETQPTKNPANEQVLAFWLRQLRNGVKEIIDDLFYYDIWNIGIIQKEITDIHSLANLEDVRWLPSYKPLCYLADPFIYRRQSSPYLLVEAYSHRHGGRGQIYRLDLDASTAELDLEPALTDAGHLSYPYIFEVNGQYYCTPEMYENNQARLYRLTNEGNLIFDSNLIKDVGVVDPTLIFYNHQWWLFFTNIQENSMLKLFAYYADNLGEVWCPHFLNPLKCDVTSARPAGKPFQLNGKLYRPAQDCSSTYGGAVTINEIVDLSPTTFREEPILQLQPDPDSPYPDGLHHLVIEDGLILIDAKKTMFDLTFKFKQFLSDG